MRTPHRVLDLFRQSVLNQCSNDRNICGLRLVRAKLLISMTFQLSQRAAITGCAKAHARFQYHWLWLDVCEFTLVAKRAHPGLERAIDYWAVELATAKLTFQRADCTCSRASEQTLALGASWASESGNAGDIANLDDVES